MNCSIQNRKKLVTYTAKLLKLSKLLSAKNYQINFMMENWNEDDEEK